MFFGFAGSLGGTSGGGITGQLDELLKSNRVLVCAGSGGVGKTTMASALAVRASQLGRRTLVLTVDPAKRLATALGLDLASDQDHPVPLEGGRLSAAVIDSKKVFDDFIATHGKKADVIARIMKNRLYQQMSTTLSGSQEFTALERLLQAVESEKYDLVVLDTPPTKHAVDFLTAPQRINSVFQDSITRWFMNPSEKPSGSTAGLLGKIVGKGTRMALKSLETLTGAQFIEELVDFFSAVRAVQQVLRDRSERARQLLTGGQTKFVVVTSFDAAKLLEAKYLQDELERLGYELRAAIINRAFPEGLDDHELKKPPGLDAQMYEKLTAFYRKFMSYHAERYRLHEEFSKGLPKTVKVVRVPEYQRDVQGLKDLESLAQIL